MVEDECEGEIQDVCRSSNNVVEVQDAGETGYVSYRSSMQAG